MLVVPRTLHSCESRTRSPLDTKLHRTICGRHIAISYTGYSLDAASIGLEDLCLRCFAQACDQVSEAHEIDELPYRLAVLSLADLPQTPRSNSHLTRASATSTPLATEEQMQMLVADASKLLAQSFHLIAQYPSAGTQDSRVCAGVYQPEFDALLTHAYRDHSTLDLRLSGVLLDVCAYLDKHQGKLTTEEFLHACRDADYCRALGVEF